VKLHQLLLDCSLGTSMLKEWECLSKNFKNIRFKEENVGVV